MMVIFVSQCEKKARKRTRRVIDAFADRIGDNTWQTVITEEGLLAVKKLLRKTASKSTAVSCHWLRSRSRSDLLWVVGNKNKFDYRGVVAVNRTKRNILHTEWENNWQYASCIQVIATIAALLHDMGKTTVGFQNKLRDSTFQGDPYRHEWISLKLFSALIAGCKTDEQWLSKFTQIDEWLDGKALKKALKETVKDSAEIAQMPSLAQWVAWLIISHHRLPPFDNEKYNAQSAERLRNDTLRLKLPLQRYYGHLRAFDYWVKNPMTIDENTSAYCQSFWRFEQLVISSSLWQKSIKRWAGKALRDSTLMSLSQIASREKFAINDTFLLYLSRLCLMVGDHNYSSLLVNSSNCVDGDASFNALAANTDRKTKATKQALDEHLLGVAAFTAKFARTLPVIASELPTVQDHAALARHTATTRFKWQNSAYRLAQTLQADSAEQGFFGVNMASTGCGKTIGNARIMYALADPKKGARFTIALGLRVLTLQTGQSFQENLRLSAEQLAILVGGQASKQLFELNQTEKTAVTNETNPEQTSDAFGSESSDELIDEWVHSDMDYRDYDELNLGTVIESKKARELLFSPIVVCTVDHLIQASECTRGGKYIAPMLRLLSSDVIFDEPDDFDPADLPALTRLIHLAGVLGSRVLLSSATLTPDLVAGLFDAYLAGRAIYHHSQNQAAPKVVCAWFDEQEKALTATQCADKATFITKHQVFSQKRATFLAKQAPQRKADILPFSYAYQYEQRQDFYGALGQKLIDGALRLHDAHHHVAPDSGKQVSVGLIRIANINNITQIATQIFAQANVPEDTHIHLCCYHARQLLILRNNLETQLDRILSHDSNNPAALFQHAEVQMALQQSEAQKHVFIVLATAVAEVGRDHDYDWAIVEPSSMRSIIQLAGRVWRHRPDKIADEVNMLLLQHNIRYFTGAPNAVVFTRPGFETQAIKAPSYDVGDLLTLKQMAQIGARPRIVSTPTETIKTLSDIEHGVMKALMNHDELNYVNAYWDNTATANRAHTLLPQISRFRAGKPQEDWLLIPDKDSDYGYHAYLAEAVRESSLAEATPQDNRIVPLPLTLQHPRISQWLVTSLDEALATIQDKMPDKSPRFLAVLYASVALDKATLSSPQSWYFDAFLGFIKK